MYNKEYFILWHTKAKLWELLNFVIKIFKFVEFTYQSALHTVQNGSCFSYSKTPNFNSQPLSVTFIEILVFYMNICSNWWCHNARKMHSWWSDNKTVLLALERNCCKCSNLFHKIIWAIKIFEVVCTDWGASRDEFSFNKVRERSL